MSKTRFIQRRKEFSQAVTRLEDALKQPFNEFYRDACIQRFEFTYEPAWKALKNYLATKDIDVRNAKDTLKSALEQGIIKDGDSWSTLHQKRNLTSHTYDEALANEAYDFLKKDGLKLLQSLKDTLATMNAS